MESDWTRRYGGSDCRISSSFFMRYRRSTAPPRCFFRTSKPALALRPSHKPLSALFLGSSCFVFRSIKSQIEALTAQHSSLLQSASEVRKLMAELPPSSGDGHEAAEAVSHQALESVRFQLRSLSAQLEDCKLMLEAAQVSTWIADESGPRWARWVRSVRAPYQGIRNAGFLLSRWQP